mmetsp:Transcript_492/g.1262  ORF Transcript_492/g.1262 Transcript_492/m.1262 type:complete len:202 (+) Transcript_492:100-705(+)
MEVISISGLFAVAAAADDSNTFTMVPLRTMREWICILSAFETSAVAAKLRRRSPKRWVDPIFTSNLAFSNGSESSAFSFTHSQISASSVPMISRISSLGFTFSRLFSLRHIISSPSSTKCSTLINDELLVRSSSTAASFPNSYMERRKSVFTLTLSKSQRSASASMSPMFSVSMFGPWYDLAKTTIESCMNSCCFSSISSV